MISKREIIGARTDRDEMKREGRANRELEATVVPPEESMQKG